MLAVGDHELESALNSLLKLDYVSRHRLFLAAIATTNFGRLRAFVETLPLLRVGYSVKTNPRPELLQEALRCGFYAECISGAEVRAAVENGFQTEELIYNGPLPATTLPVQPKFVFADSIDAYTADCSALPNSTIGIRIRPPGVKSRFGVPVEALDQLANAMYASGRRETAVSFQVRSQDYGAETFRSIASAVLSIASQLEPRTKMRVVAFNVGGGRSAAEFDASIESGDYRCVRDAAQAYLPHLKEIIVEPGQELDFSLEALVAPIVEVRNGSPLEIVVDAGLPDFPAIAKSPHRLFYLRNGRVALLPSGPDRVLGRTCLEDDVVGTVSLPASVRCGDAIVVADIGAYDSSMSYDFAEGYRRQPAL